MKPWLLIDVDDVLNWWERGHGKKRCDPPYCGHLAHAGYRKLHPPHGGTVHLNLALAAPLRRLADLADLAWCTSWGDTANRDIGPWYGLPDLPVVPLLKDPPPLPGWDVFAAGKASSVAAWHPAEGGGRPFVWLDNEPGLAEMLVVLGVPGPWSVLEVNPLTGLTAANLDTAARLLAGAAAGRPV